MNSNRLCHRGFIVCLIPIVALILVLGGLIQFEFARPSVAQADGLLSAHAENISVTVDLVGQYHTALPAVDLKVVGNLAFIAEEEGLPGNASQVEVIDISNPISPTLVTQIPISATSVDVVGNTAYFAYPEVNGFRILDVSNPISPTLLGSLDLKAEDVQVVDQLAYIIYNSQFWQSSLGIIDVSNPSEPFMRDYGGIYDAAYDLRVSGKYTCFAYWLGSTGGVDIYDATDPDDIFRSGSLDYINLGSSAMDVEKDVLYFTLISTGHSNSKALYLAALDGLPHPEIYSHYGYSSTITALDATGELLFLTTDDGEFQLLSAHDPRDVQVLLTESIPWQVAEMQVSGDWIYLATGSDGFQILRLNYPYKLYIPAARR